MIPDRIRCLDCKKASDSPMIIDELWLSVANKKNHLCLNCFEQRIGRKITRKDLRPCLWTTVLMQLVERVDKGEF
jgi:hypothetical protein